jgi:cell division protease FtsH
VDVNVIARGTPGFTGADLANLVNEAALIAARRNKKVVTLYDLEFAKDKVMMGPERRSMVMSDKERRLTAIHEAGHALVGMNIPDSDPVHKVTIVPRGRALGVTFFLPEADVLGRTKEELLAMIANAMGGRIAEEIFVGEVSTGASNDFERATKLARGMVTKYGMSDAMGTMVYADDEGGFGMHSKTISEATQQKVDAEIRRILDGQYAVARRILEEKREAVEVMANALIEWETIDAEQVKEIMDGHAPTPPTDVSKIGRFPKKDDTGPGAAAGPLGGPMPQT